MLKRSIHNNKTFVFSKKLNRKAHSTSFFFAHLKNIPISKTVALNRIKKVFIAPSALALRLLKKEKTPTHGSKSCYNSKKLSVGVRFGLIAFYKIG